MPIVQQPQYNPTSIYQPVVYEVKLATANPNEVKYCQYTINVDGVAIAKDRKEYYKTVNLGLGVFEYYFLIDVQSFLQRHYAPNKAKSSMFGTLGTATDSENTDAHAEVIINFSYLELSGLTGKIFVAPTTDVSTSVFCTLAKRQNGDQRSLAAYTASPFRSFLTKSPRSLATCSTLNQFLSYYTDSGIFNYMRVVLFDSAGLILSTDYVLTNAVPNSQNTISTGLAQLQTIPAGSWLSGVAPNFAAAASYKVDIGEGVLAPSFSYTRKTEEVFYVIEDCCSKKLKLYWLNDLGGVDSYQLPFLALEDSISADEFEKPLAWDAGAVVPHAQYDHGRLRNNIKAVRRYTIDTRVTNTEYGWLRSILWSAELYIANPNDLTEYWRVYPANITQVERAARGIIEWSFDLEISQDIVTHRV